MAATTGTTADGIVPGTTVTGLTTERWHIEDIPEAFARVSAMADRYGYLACLFGSSVKTGDGRDLDVLMTRRFQETSDYRAFLAEFGGELVKTFERPERSNHSYEVLRGGKIYHFVFGRF